MKPTTLEQMGDYLIELLSRAASVLDELGEARWSAWLRTDAERLRRRDLRGVEHVLSAFGGMGSLNDVVFPDDSPGRALLNEVYSAASEMRKEAEHCRLL